MLSVASLTTVLAVVLSGAAPAAAVEPARGSAPDVRVLPPRVRILAPTLSRKPIVGELIRADETVLVVRRTGERLLRPGWPFRRSAGETITVPRASVARFERSVRPSRKRLGATIGAIAGMAAGIALIEANKQPGDTCSGCGVLLAVPALPLALLGAAVAPGDRWAPLDATKVQVGFTRARGGAVGIRLSVSF